LRTAAGIFDYVATRELPRWVDLPTERPTEVNIAICQALKEYCCALAQMITLKKALISGGTSKSVMAKLAIDIWRKADSICGVFKSHSDFKEMNPVFKSFLSLFQGLAKATAFKYMGESAYEEGKYGLAVSYLNVASDNLKTVWIPTPGSEMSKYSSEIQSAKEDIEHIKRTFTNENNHIYFQKPVDENGLEILEGKSLMIPQDWQPPKPVYQTIQ